jgi:hypothetical protein
MSEMCSPSGALGDWSDEAPASFTPADGASANHDDSNGSWEQEWIDLGGEG